MRRNASDRDDRSGRRAGGLAGTTALRRTSSLRRPPRPRNAPLPRTRNGGEPPKPAPIARRERRGPAHELTGARDLRERGQGARPWAAELPQLVGQQAEEDRVAPP